jgi:thioredoxin reductase
MKNQYDLVVIGAGPAGMAAAINAEKYGLSVLIIEEQKSPGGQVYRSVERIDPELVDILGPDYVRGINLIEKFHQASIDVHFGAFVSHVETESDFVVSFVSNKAARQVRSERVIIAAGARERPIAIPGSTLPGVMAATAADILLKSNKIIPRGDTVLAGSGLLLLLVGIHLISAGVAIRTVLDTTPFRNYFRSLVHFPRALLALRTLYKGFQMQQVIRKSGIPVYRNVKQLEALGSDYVECVRFQTAGRIHEVETDTLFLHHGLVPDTQMTFLLDCEHEWCDVQRYWRPVVDKWGNTSVNGVAIAGDAAGIAGVDAAEISGYLAGLEAAFGLKKISKGERNQKAKPLQKKLARETYIRPFLDALYKPDPDLLVPSDPDTIVCRCEELTVGQVKKALDTGLFNPNQVKAQTRCGMGPCQGMMCGLTLLEIIADHRKVNIADLGYFRIRPPVKPVTLEQLSAIQFASQLEETDEVR